MTTGENVDKILRNISLQLTPTMSWTEQFHGRVQCVMDNSSTNVHHAVIYR